MKNLTFTVALTLLIPAISYSQTVTINANTNASALPAADRTCTGCIFDITPGYTLTVDVAISCTNCTFNGGSVDFQHSATLNTTTTFNDDTVLINSALNIQSMNFNNDSVAVNNTLKYSKGVTELANSRVSINAAVTFQSVNMIMDSIHVTASGTIATNSTPDSVSDSHITLENGATWAFSKPILSNSVFAQQANSTMTSNALTASNTTFYEDGASTTSKISGASTFTNSAIYLTNGAAQTITSPTTFTGSTIALSGSSSFTDGSSLDFESSNVSLSGTASLSTNSPLTLGTNSNLLVGDGSGAAKVSASTINVTNGSSLGVAPNASITVSSGKLTNSSGTFTVPGKTLTGCATYADAGTAPASCTILALSNIVLNATEKSAGQVFLSWTDAAQTPAYQYLIQRSIDNDRWSTIATITANAYATGDYTYIDADAPGGNLFYRIERIDADNSQTYSPISTITIAAAAAANQITVHPNPAAGGHFYLSTPGTDALIVNVYTSTGQILLHAALQGQTQYTIQLPSTSLSLTAVIVQTIYQNTTRSLTMLVH